MVKLHHGSAARRSPLRRRVAFSTVLISAMCAVSPLNAQGTSADAPPANTSGVRLASAAMAAAPPPSPAAIDVPLFEKQPRDGFLQSIVVSVTEIVTEDGELPTTDLDLSATVGLPFPTREAPLLITAAFGMDFLDTSGLDLPDELYDASLELRTLRPFGERLTFDLSVKPGSYGNTQADTSELRIQGRAVGIYQWRPETKAILGVTYLDRTDVNLLPVAGWIWTPTDALQFDILFPRPRLWLRGKCDCDSAWWLYTGGEFGGGSWGVQRANGARDIATLRDYRVLIGMERQSRHLSGHVEVGYAFGRNLEYASGLGDTTLDDAMFFRAVVNY